jgi:hypothetical protein
MRRCLLVLATAIAAAAAALPASASPQSDFNAVYADWKKDLKITPCQWSQAQLQNTYDIARSNPDFQYETKFVDDTQREINRWKSGGCSGIQPLSVRKKSPLFGVHIVSVRGRGGAARELVKIRNGKRKTVSFRNASLVNIKGAGYFFPARFKLAKGRTATVHIGCAKGVKRRATFTTRSVWLCGTRGLFRDRGDLARLADAKRLVVSERGFGSERNRPVF